MFKLGFVLLILSLILSWAMPPRFNGWERRDLLSTVPFAIGAILIALSLLTAAWKYLP